MSRRTWESTSVIHDVFSARLLLDLLDELDHVESCRHGESFVCLSPVPIVSSANSSFVISGEMPNQVGLSIPFQINGPRVVSLTVMKNLPTDRVELSREEQTECQDDISLVLCVMLDIVKKSCHSYSLG